MLTGIVARAVYAQPNVRHFSRLFDGSPVPAGRLIVSVSIAPKKIEYQSPSASFWTPPPGNLPGGHTAAHIVGNTGKSFSVLFAQKARAADIVQRPKEIL